MVVVTAWQAEYFTKHSRPFKRIVTEARLGMRLLPLLFSEDLKLIKSKKSFSC